MWAGCASLQELRLFNHNILHACVVVWHPPTIGHIHLKYTLKTTQCHQCLNKICVHIFWYKWNRTVFTFILSFRGNFSLTLFGYR